MRTFWKFLPLKRSTTIWMTMATTIRITKKRNPFQVSADSARNTPARTAYMRMPFLEGSSASAALTILTMNHVVKASRKAASPYSVPLEKTVVLMGRARNANTRAATTPTLLSNISLATRNTGMQVSAPITGFRAARAAEAASDAPIPVAVSTDAIPAPRKSIRGG